MRKVVIVLFLIVNCSVSVSTSNSDCSEQKKKLQACLFLANSAKDSEKLPLVLTCRSILRIDSICD